MAPDSIWEIVFLMVILKIPIVYLCWVVWWAVRSEPRPEEGAAITAVVGDRPQGGTDTPRLARRPGPRPHGRPLRRPVRVARAGASARAKLGP